MFKGRKNSCLVEEKPKKQKVATLKSSTYQGRFQMPGNVILSHSMVTWCFCNPAISFRELSHVVSADKAIVMDGQIVRRSH